MTTPLGNASAEDISAHIVQQLTSDLPKLPTDWTHAVSAYTGDLALLLESAQRTQQKLFALIEQTIEPPHVLLLALQQHAAQVCTRVALQSFSSYQQAQKVQLIMNDLITAVVEYPSLRETYTIIELSAWNDLRVKIANAIQEQQMILPVIKHVDISHELPAVVIAHRLFQDAERAEELIAQNQFEHPSFCSGTIEYLGTE